MAVPGEPMHRKMRSFWFGVAVALPAAIGMLTGSEALVVAGEVLSLPAVLVLQIRVGLRSDRVVTDLVRATVACCVGQAIINAIAFYCTNVWPMPSSLAVWIGVWLPWPSAALTGLVVGLVCGATLRLRRRGRLTLSS